MMLLLLVALVVASESCGCSAAPFAIYGDANGNQINVTSSTGTIVKTLYVSASGIQSIAIHYQKDLIFAADGSKVIKIHLLDDNGQRKISGIGKLFLDQKANHFESVLIRFSFFGISESPSSLMVDHVAEKLYIGGEDFLYEMHLNGSNVRKAFKAPEFFIGRNVHFKYPTLHNGEFYFGVSSTYYMTSYNGLYQGTLETRGTVNLTLQNMFLREDGIASIAVDESKDKLFYVNRYMNQIRFIELDQSKSDIPTSAKPTAPTKPTSSLSSPTIGPLITTSSRPIATWPTKKHKTVLSNYRLTNDLRALAVHGRHMFWSSGEDRKLYFGELNEDMNFLPLDDITTLRKDVRILQIAVFESGSKRMMLSLWLFLLAVVAIYLV